MANTDILNEYDTLLKRFNKAFEYTWEKGDKMDIAFNSIVDKLSSLEASIKGVEVDNKKGIWYKNT